MIGRAFALVAPALIFMIAAPAYGQNIFWHASKGDTEAVEGILKRFPSKVNARDINNGTPLMICAQEGREDICELLLEKGAEPDAQNNQGNAALHFCAKKGYLDICGMLLDSGASTEIKNLQGIAPLHEAAREDHPEVCGLLIEKGADVNVTDLQGGTPLHKAADRGHVEVARLLIDKGAELNRIAFIGGSPLHQSEGCAMTRLLLDAGADPNLREPKANDTPLHSLALRGNAQCCGLLLDRGADVNATNMVGFTPLHYAASAAKDDVARLLIERGADMEARDDQGLAPLHWAVGLDRMDTAIILIEKGSRHKRAGRETGAVPRCTGPRGSARRTSSGCSSRRAPTRISGTTTARPPSRSPSSWAGAISPT